MRILAVAVSAWRRHVSKPIIDVEALVLVVEADNLTADDILNIAKGECLKKYPNESHFSQKVSVSEVRHQTIVAAYKSIAELDVNEGDGDAVVLDSDVWGDILAL